MYIYLSEFFLEWEMFQTKVVEKVKIHILYSINVFQDCAIYEIMWKNTLDRQATKENVMLRREDAISTQNT
jgi:hypothetical protein